MLFFGNEGIIIYFSTTNSSWGGGGRHLMVDVEENLPEII